MASILLFQESIFSSLLVPRIIPMVKIGHNTKAEGVSRRALKHTMQLDGQGRCDTCEYASCDLSWSPGMVTPGRANDMTWMQQFTSPKGPLHPLINSKLGNSIESVRPLQKVYQEMIILTPIMHAHSSETVCHGHRNKMQSLGPEVCNKF